MGRFVVDELAGHRVGGHLTVDLYRQDQQLTVHLKPVMIENTVAAPGPTAPTPAVIGATINPDAQTLGAAIASVVQGSPADLGGLVVGDTVTAPDGAAETLRVTPDPADVDNENEPTPLPDVGHGRSLDDLAGADLRFR